MAGCGNGCGWAAAAVQVTTLVIALGVAGCGPKAAQPPKPDEPAAGEPNPSPGDPGALEARLHQSFAEATLQDPPDEWQRPPETTLTGKSVGKLYDEVIGLWDGIRFLTPGGRRLGYRAILDTDTGTIEIAFRPDLAPNHVRSFIALARAGYYDGLVFERTVHEEGPESKLELIEAGCPMGTGEMGYGSVGYWLKPELNPEAAHEEGTVGASHGVDSQAAACKFYITLCKAPFMDGEYTVFGKVVRGLDVARKILSLPIRDDAPEGDLPAKPVVIRKVTIVVNEVENWAMN